MLFCTVILVERRGTYYLVGGTSCLVNGISYAVPLVCIFLNTFHIPLSPTGQSILFASVISAAVFLVQGQYHVPGQYHLASVICAAMCHFHIASICASRFLAWPVSSALCLVSSSQYHLCCSVSCVLYLVRTKWPPLEKSGFAKKDKSTTS